MLGKTTYVRPSHAREDLLDLNQFPFASNRPK